MAAVSTLSALSTRLLSAPVTMLSAMTPQAVKAAISTVPMHQAHSSRNWLPRTCTGMPDPFRKAEHRGLSNGCSIDPLRTFSTHLLTMLSAMTRRR